MIQFGNDKIKDIYVGSDKIKEVYYGSELVWGGEVEPIEGGYWVHKDTGVVTSFDADADFITDGIMSKPSWATNCSKVNIPEGVTILVARCFQNCSSLTSITLPESVTSIGALCFAGCSSLTSINIPESVNSLENDTFHSCSSLTSITFPEGVTSLGNSCFYGCSSFISITLPENITSLGLNCFRNCSSLTLATVLPATPPSLGSNAFNSVHASFNIKVRSPYVDDYKTATNWTAHAGIISAI